MSPFIERQTAETNMRTSELSLKRFLGFGRHEGGLASCVQASPVAAAEIGANQNVRVAAEAAEAPLT